MFWTQYLCRSETPAGTESIAHLYTVMKIRSVSGTCRSSPSLEHIQSKGWGAHRFDPGSSINLRWVNVTIPASCKPPPGAPMLERCALTHSPFSLTLTVSDHALHELTQADAIICSIPPLALPLYDPVSGKKALNFFAGNCDQRFGPKFIS